MRYLLAVMALVFAGQDACAGQGRESAAAPTNAGVLAVVLGRTIGADQRPVALSLIFSSIIDKFASDNKLTVDESDVDTYLQAVRRNRMEMILRLENRRQDVEKEKASPVLSDAAKAKKAMELEQLERLLKRTREEVSRVEGTGDEAKKDRLLAAERIRKWKANQALFRKYGGRVIGPIQEPESFDGKKAYFKEQEAAGAFRIFDKKLEAFFWNVLTNELLYSKLFVPEKDRESAMNSPWWLAGRRTSNLVSSVSVEVQPGGRQPESGK